MGAIGGTDEIVTLHSETKGPSIHPSLSDEQAFCFRVGFSMKISRDIGFPRLGTWLGSKAAHACVILTVLETEMCSQVIK